MRREILSCGTRRVYRNPNQSVYDDAGKAFGGPKRVTRSLISPSWRPKSKHGDFNYLNTPVPGGFGNKTPCQPEFGPQTTAAPVWKAPFTLHPRLRQLIMPNPTLHVQLKEHAPVSPEAR